MAKTYDPIATYTVSGSAATSYTFSSITSGYTDLVLVVNGVASSAGNFNPRVSFNSDTASNYSNTWVYGNGSAAGSGRTPNNTYIFAGTFYTSRSMQVMQFLNYSNTSTYKTMLSRNSDSAVEASEWVGLWRSTAAINSITIAANGSYEIGTTMNLYGIKAA